MQAVQATDGSMSGWLHVHGDCSLDLIAEMAELQAWYVGRGWFRIGASDVPVRTMLNAMQREHEAGKVPEDLLCMSRRERVLLHALRLRWRSASL